MNATIADPKHSSVLREKRLQIRTLNEGDPRPYIAGICTQMTQGLSLDPNLNHAIEGHHIHHADQISIKPTMEGQNGSGIEEQQSDRDVICRKG